MYIYKDVRYMSIGSLEVAGKPRPEVKVRGPFSSIRRTGQQRRLTKLQLTVAKLLLNTQR
jgi:hypothetical protein